VLPADQGTTGDPTAAAGMPLINTFGTPVSIDVSTWQLPVLIVTTLPWNAAGSGIVISYHLNYLDGHILCLRHLVDSYNLPLVVDILKRMDQESSPSSLPNNSTSSKSPPITSISPSSPDSNPSTSPLKLLVSL
jgi:hypothetical protein